MRGPAGRRQVSAASVRARRGSAAAERGIPVPAPAGGYDPLHSFFPGAPGAPVR
ncbi:hypothetical protein [Streptomyces sp. NPDC001985]|uniref:hypothetical protein n=1 Tax=Streptomyces sp. NPDC001985 TaxID=3154406 RepID=UPI00332B9F98